MNNLDSKILSLMKWDECPDKKDLAPSSPNCQKCPFYLGREVIDFGHYNEYLTHCGFNLDKIEFGRIKDGMHR